MKPRRMTNDVREVLSSALAEERDLRALSEIYQELVPRAVARWGNGEFIPYQTFRRWLASEIDRNPHWLKPRKPPRRRREGIAALAAAMQNSAPDSRYGPDLMNSLSVNGAIGGLGGYLSAGAMQQQAATLFTQQQMNAVLGYAAPMFVPEEMESLQIPGTPRGVQRRLGGIVKVPRGTVSGCVPLWGRIAAALRGFRWWWFVHMEAGAAYRQGVMAGILRLRERPWWTT